MLFNQYEIVVKSCNEYMFGYALELFGCLQIFIQIFLLKGVNMVKE